eukprot:300713-Rhodomonas_salina.1
MQRLRDERPWPARCATRCATRCAVLPYAMCGTDLAYLTYAMCSTGLAYGGTRALRYVQY